MSAKTTDNHDSVSWKASAFSFTATAAILVFIGFSLGVFSSIWRLSVFLVVAFVAHINFYDGFLNWKAGDLVGRNRLAGGGDETVCSTDGCLPPVAFVLPSYCEPYDVCLMTLNSVLATDYPNRRIVVVDNSPPDYPDLSRWAARVRRAGGLFIHYYPSADLKPGNIDLALTRIGESLPEVEFVFFLDVDSSVPQDGRYLRDAIRDFDTDPGLGFVQFVTRTTNWHFSRLTRVFGLWLDLRQVRLAVAAQGGFPFFCGHNALWRLTALRQAGPFTKRIGGRIVTTEDTLASCQAQLAGYHGAYSQAVRCGEWVPNSLVILGRMWTRWTTGTLQVCQVLARNLVSCRAVSRLGRNDFFQHVADYLVAPFVYALLVAAALGLLPAAVGWMALLAWLSPEILGLRTLYGLSHGRTVPARLLDIALVPAVKAFTEFAGLKSLLAYLTGDRFKTGWLLTAKGIVGRDGWLPALSRHWPILAVGLAYLVPVPVHILTGETVRLVRAVPAAVFGLLHLLSVLLFFRDGRHGEDRADTATIETA